MSENRTKARVAMFHLNGQVRFNAGYRRQDMIQDLLGPHPERSAARADLKPTGLVPVIALSEMLGPDVCSQRLERSLHACLGHIMFMSKSAAVKRIPGGTPPFYPRCRQFYSLPADKI
jgi:hypothetical protein